MTPLPRSEYLSLTTYRRTGVPVPTHVWAPPDGINSAVDAEAELIPSADHPEARAALRRAYGRHDLTAVALGAPSPRQRHELIRSRPV